MLQNWNDLLQNQQLYSGKLCESIWIFGRLLKITLVFGYHG